MLLVVFFVLHLNLLKMLLSMLINEPDWQVANLNVFRLRLLTYQLAPKVVNAMKIQLVRSSYSEVTSFP